MDYTAITVSLITLFGLMFQLFYNTKTVKRSTMRKEVQENKEALALIKKGQRYQLQERLEALCTKVIEKGYVTINEKKLIVNLYYTYKELDGNEFISDLFEIVDELPIKKNRIEAM